MCNAAMPLLSLFSIRVGSAQLMTSAQHATTGNLKGMEGAERKGHLPEQSGACSKCLEPGSRGRESAGHLPEEAGACLGLLEPSGRGKELAGELLEKKELQLG